ncbi:MAG: CopG family transcriptional regulator [Nitrospirae bacterium]|nr:CopG family transcriptional regulator [Nitrospirota bacterium]MDA1304871.1 CopG family transcriptional regulator [Nitrospirota bacterium]
MKAKSLEKKFDEGKDISQNLDLSKSRRPLQEQKRVNVDFPTWMIDSLDKEASRLGVTRQSIIKVWLSERLQQSTSHKKLHSTAESGGRVRR